MALTLLIGPDEKPGGAVHHGSSVSPARQSLWRACPFTRRILSGGAIFLTGLRISAVQTFYPPSKPPVAIAQFRTRSVSLFTLL